MYPGVALRQGDAWIFLDCAVAVSPIGRAAPGSTLGCSTSVRFTRAESTVATRRDSPVACCSPPEITNVQFEEVKYTDGRCKAIGFRMVTRLRAMATCRRIRSFHWLLCLGWLFVMVPAPSYSANTTQTTSVLKLSEDRAVKDFIRFINATDVVEAKYKLSIEYLCSEPSTVGVEVLVSTDVKIGVTVYRKKWKCKKRLNTFSNRTLWVKFPNIMLYRPDNLIKHSIVINNVILRAWIINTNRAASENREATFYEQAIARTYKLLKTFSPFERPYKDHKHCLQWDTEKIEAIKEKHIPQCLLENDVVELLCFPFALTGLSYGITKRLKNFNNLEMELTGKQLLNNPRFTISIWIYVLKACKRHLCGILHQINEKQKYGTPLLFLTSNGNIHFQMTLSSGKSVAGLSNFKVVLRRWCRLDLTMQGRHMTLTVSYGEKLQARENAVYTFPGDVHHNVLAGYFVLGGSNYVQSFEGFIGPVKFYRVMGPKGEKISNPLVITHNVDKHIDRYYRKCKHINLLIIKYLKSLGLLKTIEKRTRNNDYYLQLLNGSKDDDGNKCPARPWGKRTEKRYKALFDLLQTMASDPLIDATHLPNLPSILNKVGEKLYWKTMEKLTGADGIKQIGHHISSLIEASCCGYYKAAYLLGVIFETGLGVEVQSSKGMLYSLVAAQGNDRLALLHLGYKHDQGIDGYPLDYGVSYGYYINIAQRTVKDRHDFDVEQAFVEHVRLMDDSVLQRQTKENEDFFLWLRYQAKHGDAFAQQKLARMLYWGQQGITRDVQRAMKWYSRSAMELKHPASMFEYGLFLIKGQGVKKNTELGLRLITEAASKGITEAINALGWYYETHQKDYVKAAEYWKEAVKRGNLDAFHNLGVLYESGTYPGKPQKNVTEAFPYYYKAGFGGHLESLVRCSFFWNTGNFEYIPHNPKQAVLWARYVAEQNGFLGYNMRRALDAYLQNSWNEALLYFLITAETGIELSQTNVAYLCEERTELKNSCADFTWRYYKLSTFQQNVHPFVLVKMGDFYYYGHKSHEKDIEQSIEMYTSAALLNYSQAFYNLGSLAEEGLHIPQSVSDLLNLNTRNQFTNFTLQQELYERCITVDVEEAFIPCSIALLRVHLKTMWIHTDTPVLLYTAISMLLSTLICFAMKRYWDFTGVFSL
ncbi:protein sel-1 homolog 3-like isoform X4 [Leucoraja erinacea]|uniref:protein sel-1 homolog 3-like isoform X4 n=1 Tax=Leucoraja erinaceus TaxID=7782 RepID=UPI002457F040|nr:protein sel-1 homolog 3-like isoform X4 [Leucoraja erinacea]